jgi:predicted amidohydrolase
MTAASAPLAAIIQMTSHTDPAVNLRHIDAALAEAASAGAVMAFLPEMSLMLDKDRSRSAPHIVPETESEALKNLQKMAAQHGLWLHTGSIAFESDDGQKRANRSHVIDADGNIQSRYDKIHMFDVNLSTGEKWTESSAYEGGSEIAVVDTPLGKLGLTICYDLRFPELFRALVDGGAEIIALPAAFTVPTGEAHWHVLLRARAIETASYVLAAAQAGHHADGRATYGHSLAIAPWGEVLADAGPANPDQPYHIITARIDRAEVEKARQSVPLANSRATRNIAL